MSAVAATVLDALQIAHDIGVPHQEPVGPPPGNSGGASTIVIIIGVIVTIALVGALIWLKNRAD